MDSKNDFFPSADYKIPETSNYLKLTEGEHNFRVLSSAIVGYEYFTNENKVVRSKEPFDEVPDIKANGRVNHFWAFVVWNYDQKKIQILEITQKTIMTQIQALIKSPKWGNPKRYDITITRKGTGINDTEYAVMPNPHAPLEETVEEEYQKVNINLDAMYHGDDPFNTPKKNSDGSSMPKF